MLIGPGAATIVADLASRLPIAHYVAPPHKHPHAPSEPGADPVVDLVAIAVVATPMLLAALARVRRGRRAGGRDAGD